jgi:hypothetical protein
MTSCPWSRIPKDVLTKQQRAIVDLVNRSYSLPQVGRYLGISPSQCSDQISFARKKGVEVNLLSAHEAKRRVNYDEARRIAREARS